MNETETLDYKGLEKGDIVVTNFGEFEYTGEWYEEELAPDSPWGEKLQFVKCDLGDIDTTNIVSVKKGNPYDSGLDNLFSEED